MPPLRLLLVEDQLKQVETQVEFFRGHCGYEALVAMKGMEAVEIVNKERPPVMLLDLYLEDISGLRVLREAKALDPNIIVIVLTGFPDEDIREKAMAYGADDYVVKPVDLLKLKEKLDAAAKRVKLRAGG